ncbi:branched-chain amino acid ABC transporter permease [Thermus sp.]|uniref:branched-chain amino acid ABC transporter permease n=1 Tax=Thermus sp. TaxID=275 RepID=UPI0025E9F474|nr:branched-chain amino acid ABC transporter permease [Thermus sp.]MCS6868142.1 branched-chain amino acid ABC transporter permease [Thermus sp.]MCX7849461.1 branched-chain amino acid ABC transporter permease [Thermus sp.]MDW8017503.1 branched-chain amino acid ABC transporter permease [Thermus sp.]MDW8357806.1 branched-chain amino acid ABC transporter permease [Thermus sp.]
MMAWLPKIHLREGRAWAPYLLRAALLGAFFLPALFQGYALYLATEAALLGLAAVALSFLLGHGGIPSLGQAAFLGLGAYALGLALKAGLPLALALALAPLVAAAFALLTGLLLFRTHGIFVLMLTLAFGQMVYSVAHKWNALTGGDDGLSLSGVAVNPLALHLGALLALFLSVAGLRHLLVTPYGKALEALRQNEEKARSLGLAAFAFKLWAYVLAGALTGLAGAGLALHRTFVSPHDLFWLTSATLMVMVLLGGSRGLFGAAFGALLYTFVQAWVSSFTELWGLFVGILLILTVLFAREGLWPLLERKLGGKHGSP